MLVNTPDAETTAGSAATDLGADLGAIAALVERLAVLGRERDQRERDWAEQRGAVQRATSQAIERLREEAALPTGPDTLADDLGALHRERDRRQAALASAGVRQRRSLRDELERSIASLSDDVPDPADLADQQTALLRKRRQFLTILARQRQRVVEIERDIAVTMRRSRLPDAVADPAEEPARLTIPSAPDQGLDAVRVQLDWVEAKLKQVLAAPGCAPCRPAWVIQAILLIAAPHVAAVALFTRVIDQPWWTPWAGLSLILAMVALGITVSALRRRLGAHIAEVAAKLPGFTQALAHLEQRGLDAFDPKTHLHQRVGRVLRLDAAKAERGEELKAVHERAVVRSKARELALRERLDARVTAATAILRQRAYEAGVGRVAAIEARLAAAEADQQRRIEAAATAIDADAARLGIAAQGWVAEARALAGAQQAWLRALHPTWDDAARWADWQPGERWSRYVPIGILTATVGDLAAAADATRLALDGSLRLDFPVTLAYPAIGSLLLRCRPDGREAGLRLLEQTALRALTGVPAGRLRLTVIDPLGLGQSFPRLLDLGEHDETVLAGGVLSEATRIERGLDDLGAHLEKVIQKHLRGRYATLDDYNREAGELQEPIRLVLVADFPAGFGERALERLAVLLRSGARCGVHLLILHDDRQALPAALDLAWFRRIGLVVRQVHGHFALDRDGVHAFRLEPEPAPSAALSSRLITAIGTAAISAKRVAVAFDAIAPDGPLMWSVSTGDVLRLPIGKRGADRLQYLELGRGTAQHVLVGGRTGSGKSTLFHVLIASAALWCHPRELELHLIDFKKGVEFKAYATHRLPHAKVVAIESDREFGLSVLRQLDGELARRGDLYRAVGAQDLAAHRRLAGTAGGEHLPRILLIIDEFQELFTEDDAIARDAALLLDRFVRQGRAFGLHVILGSQTLGGSYSLAKSSLGQMGVRIVLPCNESDAHLLLHEENDAARLLTRPGDAIYNDQAGLIDGNSPFQVCWLSDAEEAGHLREVAARAGAEGWRPAQQVIFEGDGPSRIEDDAGLSALLGRPWQEADARTRAWIGQASSLRGSAEVVLPTAAGGNLIIIGQHRDAAVATWAAITIGLAARHRTDGIRLVTLDGEDGDGPCARMHAVLARHLPHPLERKETRDAPTLVKELASELERRQDGGIHPPIILTVFAVQRLRALRADDDSARGRDEATAETFARLLANGAEYGIHVIAWCDGLGSLQRSLGRRALRDFDQRICFQMSAADSSEILDDDAASRLGLHNALIAVPGEGRREKFRPFAMADESVVERIGGMMRQRAAPTPTGLPGDG